MRKIEIVSTIVAIMALVNFGSCRSKEPTYPTERGAMNCYQKEGKCFCLYTTLNGSHRERKLERSCVNMIAAGVEEINMARWELDDKDVRSALEEEEP